MNRDKKILTNPLFETTINKAVFLHQEIIVYPDKDLRLPDNITKVIKYLFGESATITEDWDNGCPIIIIKGACYVLKGAKTINADYTTIIKE